SGRRDPAFSRQGDHERRNDLYDRRDSRGLCDLSKSLEPDKPPPADCTPDLSVAGQTRASGWLTGTYHSIYEDFARGLVASNYHGSRSFISDDYLVHEKQDSLPPLHLDSGDDGFPNLKATIQQVQQDVLGFADPVADHLLATFGNGYRYD